MECRLFLVQDDATGLTKSDRTSNSRRCSSFLLLVQMRSIHEYLLLKIGTP
jgi:hypothetical protein